MTWFRKFSFDDESPVSPTVPERYEDIGHGQLAIPWVYVGDKLLLGKINHLEIVRELAEQMGGKAAYELYMNSWRGRYDPLHHEMSMVVENAEVAGQEIQPPMNLILLLRNKFPEVEKIWSFPGSRPVLGHFDNDALERIYKFTWKHRFVKEAQYVPSEVPTFYDEEFKVTINDVDRYTSDQYKIIVQIAESLDKYSIGLHMFNSHVGICGQGQYWHYKKRESSKAKKTFAKITNIVQKLRDEIEYTRPPMAIIAPMFRSAMHYIDYPHRERSGVYHYNWFEELPKEADWRSTLYGKRYPNTPTTQAIGSFVNVDEQSKEVVSEGSPRQRQVFYKQASDDPLWLATYIGKHWRWSVPTAITFLTWFASVGGNQNQLIQDVQQGASPTEVLHQIQLENQSDNVEQVSENVFDPILEEEMPDFPEISSNQLDTSIDSSRMSLSRGIRNNNPGNIRRTDVQWQGLAESQNDESFLMFESPEYGVRAMARVLRNYQRRHNLKTVEQIIARWAPVSENDTASYVQHVLQQLKLPPNSEIDLGNDDLLTRLIQVMIRHENGDSIDENTIRNGILLEKSSSTESRITLAWTHKFSPIM